MKFLKSNIRSFEPILFGSMVHEENFGKVFDHFLRIKDKNDV